MDNNLQAITLNRYGHDKQVAIIAFGDGHIKTGVNPVLGDPELSFPWADTQN